MSQNLNQLNQFADGLIAALSPANQKKLAQLIATKLRASQAARIAAQQNPDGSRYDPRKKQSRQQSNTRKRMFTKIRQRKYLSAKGTAEAATVRFSKSASRIARVHQEGLRDRVRQDSNLRVKYAQRELLGFSRADEEMIQDTILTFLADAQ